MIRKSDTNNSMVVSLGPTSMASYRNLPKNPRADGTGANPRCLRRDINRNAAMGATADHAYKLLTQSKDINTFYNTLLGSPVPKGDPYPWGVSPTLNQPYLILVCDKTNRQLDPHGRPLHPRRRPGR
jgi:hypothetical protein